MTLAAALAPAMMCAGAARQAASRHEVARSPGPASRRAEAYALDMCGTVHSFPESGYYGT